MDPVDLYNAEGRRIAEDRRRDHKGGGGVAPSDGRLLNGWTACWAIVGFVLGQVSSQSLVGALMGGLLFGGAVVVVQVVLRALGVALGAGVAGLGALNTTLGRIPQWIIYGALAGAGCAAVIAIWLDGESSELVGPMLLLAPVGAVAGLVIRLVALALRRDKAG